MRIDIECNACSKSFAVTELENQIFEIIFFIIKTLL